MIRWNVIIDAICRSLFEAENRRIQNWIDKLTRANQTIRNNRTLEGFLHEGVYYRPSWLGRGIWPHGPLHDDLVEEARIFVADRENVLRDQQFIRQILFTLLYPCNTDQDARDTLPECLMPIIGPMGFNIYSRTREPAWSIQGNARAIRQYEKILPKIEEYAAARMIF